MPKRFMEVLVISVISKMSGFSSSRVEKGCPPKRLSLVAFLISKGVVEFRLVFK